MGKKNKQQTFTRVEIARMKEEITYKTLVLFIAAAVEEFDWTFEDIRKYATRLNRYKQAVDDKLISLRQVQEIIQDEIGVNIKGW